MKLLSKVIGAIVVLALAAGAITIYFAVGESSPVPNQKSLALAVAIQRYDDEVGVSTRIEIEIIDQGEARDLSLPNWAGSYLYIVGVNGSQYAIRCYSDAQCEAYAYPIA